ncbi:transglutaminase domain-containing protein [Flavobacterium sp. RHBU_3]|uniref:transglutaminase domain-containing protein n=1 Tax=Flavobacterium sp. RHBU_3 TaxID=3391184 RepID=UPI003984FF39
MKSSRPHHLLYHLLLLFCVTAFAQAPQTDFTQLDSISRKKKYNGDLPLLVSQLTESCTTQTEKARAIFVWITDNIAYDCKAFNKHKLPKRPKPKKGKNYNDIVAQWKIDYTNRVLRKGKAVCEGYAMLFKRMCDYAGLQTDYVPGYVKNQPNQIGRMGTNDHAWNGIILDEKYYFLDVTWAAGGCTIDKKGHLDEFFKSFNNFYWLTPTEKFCMDHYPEDKTNPGAAEYPVEKYRDNPYIKKDYIRNTEITLPSKGIVEAKLGSVLTFSFNTDAYFEKISLNTNTKRQKTYTINKDESNKYLEYTEDLTVIPFSKNDKQYTFQYTVTNPNVRFIEVYLDDEMVMRFNIKVNK